MEADNRLKALEKCFTASCFFYDQHGYLEVVGEKNRAFSGAIKIGFKGLDLGETWPDVWEDKVRDLCIAKVSETPGFGDELEISAVPDSAVASEPITLKFAVPWRVSITAKGAVADQQFFWPERLLDKKPKAVVLVDLHDIQQRPDNWQFCEHLISGLMANDLQVELIAQGSPAEFLELWTSLISKAARLSFVDSTKLAHGALAKEFGTDPHCHASTMRLLRLRAEAAETKVFVAIGNCMAGGCAALSPRSEALTLLIADCQGQDEEIFSNRDGHCLDAVDIIYARDFQTLSNVRTLRAGRGVDYLVDGHLNASAPAFAAKLKGLSRDDRAKIRGQLKRQQTIDLFARSQLDRLRRRDIVESPDLLIGSDADLTAIAIDYVSAIGRRPTRIYSDDPRMWGRVIGGITILPAALLALHEPKQVVVIEFDKPRVQQLQQVAHAFEIETVTLFPSVRLADHKGWAALENRHSGDTVFVLGNGPSVDYADLDLLAGRTVFAANRFHLAYQQTSLRPTYTTLCDRLMIEQHFDEISQACGTPLFKAVDAMSDLGSSPKNILNYSYLDGLAGIEFSPDPAKGLGNGASVLFDMLQIAVFTGAKKIVLYGVDFDFSDPPTKGPETIVTKPGPANHFLPDYRAKNEFWYYPNWDLIGQALHQARDFADRHNIEIVNASRRTRLDIFPLIPLDQCLREEK